MQDLIAGVLRNATEKLAAEQTHPTTTGTTHPTTTGKSAKTTGKTTTEKTAELTDPMYIEKLAAACEYIAANSEELFPTEKGVLQSALEKMAGAEQIGAGHGATALPVSASIGGHQKYKKDKPAGEDPAASEAGAAETTGGLPGGSTQMPNNIGVAPGQSSGAVPHATYPAKGPLVNLSKAASVRDFYMMALTKLGAVGDPINVMTGGPVEHGQAAAPATPKPAAPAAAAAAAEKPGFGRRALDVAKKVVKYPGQGGWSGGTTTGQRVGRWAARGGLGLAAAGGLYAGGRAAFGHGDKSHKTKTASETAREMILRKLAGEDVMKANIDGGGRQGPLVGEGQLQVADATRALPHQAGGPTGGFGNQGRSYIQSNAAAINYTKKDAKGPVKTQLKEVLEQPALSAKHDSKLQENLRNTGKAGVKIAAVAFLQKIAGEGCTCDGKGECRYCHMRSAISDKSTGKTKTATGELGGMGGGGGMTQMGDAGQGADGCQCGGAGECRVCKLKAALAAAKGGANPTMGAPGGGQQPGMGEAQPKDL
jgi:hypothetical protein